MNILFDHDGVLCHTPAGTNYDDEVELLAKCVPRHAVLRHIQDLSGQGHRLGIITARGAHVANVTRLQHRLWLGPISRQLSVHFRPRPLYEPDRVVNDKAEQIRAEEGHVYIGDGQHDLAAALRAGAAFLWDHQFEATGLAGLRMAPESPQGRQR